MADHSGGKRSGRSVAYVSKRRKFTPDEASDTFESQLALLATQFADGGNQSQSGHCSQEDNHWERRPLTDGLGQDNHIDVAMQLVDMDHYIDGKDNVVVRLFGATRLGNSICLLAKDFLPYFYVEINEQFGPEHIEKAKYILNELFKAQGLSGSGLSKAASTLVVDLEIVYGTSLYGYHSNTHKKFLKVYVRAPRLFSAGRRIFQQGVDLFGNGKIECYATFEANVDFEVRFMADLDITSCGWIVLPMDKYTIVSDEEKISRCQLECVMSYRDIVVHSPEEAHEWSEIAPLRILSFDIECIGRRGVFPDAHYDSVIQIANMVKIQGEDEPFIRNCFALKETAPIIGSQVISCNSEAELLEKWADFVRIVDPDLVTGYNVQNFDFPYILERSRTLKIEGKVSALCRVKGLSSKTREVPLSSRQMGNRSNKITNMEGRVIFDVFQVVQRDYKLRSYSLNSVSYHFIGEQKEDVDYSIIADLQNATPVTRRRLAVYCMKDAYLPLRLLDKLMSVINYVEMARVTGVPLDFLLSRGQQVKIVSQLLRKARSLNVYLPVIESTQTESTYEGATVIEPIRGFYNEPIATLDFASLYPSIMIAHNICYTTLIMDPKESVADEDFIISPTNNRFVKPHLRHGILPQILEDLLSARKRAKADLKEATDPFRKMVLNGRQLALKISANSVYGFTGATAGRLPCLEISQSVTAFGRKMIDFTKKCVEESYKAGACDGRCPIDAKVVYGDTDSVMVRFGVKDVQAAMDLGLHAATEVSKRFKQPIKLEFEKVYYPFLLINKKRYAGLFFTKPDKHDKMDCKGLETVRRDNCPLVSNVLSACLEKLLLNRDATMALQYAKKVISDLLCNRIDISELIITKELTRSSEAYAAKQAHVILAERLRQRDAGSAPRLGDRVPYVIVARGQKIPAYEKAEDPLYVLQNNVPVDTLYYLENQLAKPLARIFEPIIGDKAEQILINGEHTLVRTSVHVKNTALSHFFQKTERCLVCKSNLPKGDASPTCSHCKPEEGKAFVKQMAILNVAESQFSRLWTECQNCASTMNCEVMCSSRDCPIFYMREKIRYDMEEQMKAVRRFTKTTW